MKLDSTLDDINGRIAGLGPGAKKTHGLSPLSLEDAPGDPAELFLFWLEDALRAARSQPLAMTLATASAGGRPSARIVLLRHIDPLGYCFFTNYDSRKGRELTENPFAAIILFWAELDRQIRVEGRVERTAATLSDAYFEQRPRDSRIAAIASPQSQTLAARRDFETQVQRVSAQYEGVESIPRPAHWGGFRLVPSAYEFWQEVRNRMHVRVRYTRKQPDGWTKELLAP